MFWPIVLLVKLTLGLFLAIIALGSVLAPFAGMRRGTVFFSLVGLSIIVFIPSCTAIMERIDTTRFGEFDYELFADITDRHTVAYMPSKSTEIHTCQQPNGCWATFKIEESDLIHWFESEWQRYGDYSITERDVSGSELGDLRSDMDRHFVELEWALPEPDVCYAGPIASDGATFQIWYNRENNTGVLWGCYW